MRKALLSSAALLFASGASISFAACSSFGGDEAVLPEEAGAAETGAANDASAAVDAAADGDAPVVDGGTDARAPCNDDPSFKTPVELTDLAGAVSVRFTADGKTAFVAFSANDGSLDISEGDYPKGALNYATVLSGPDDETSPAPVADPLRLFFQGRAGGAPAIMHASRSQLGQRFDGAAPILPLDGAVAWTDPWALSPGTVLYATLTPGAVGRSDLYRLAASATSGWTTTVVAGLSSGAIETNPVVSDDERSIFFARALPDATPRADIFLATRTSTTLDFSAPLPLDTLNDPLADNRPLWLSPDHCELVLSRKSGGTTRIYRASR